MIEYPKIDTLYDRDENFRVMPGALRRPEFAVPRRWIVTEKVDGTNIRVGMTADGAVRFAGRTDNAQIPPHLLAYLAATFTPERMAAAFEPEKEVVLFGEGYGPKIQSGGDYRPDVGFALFDVWLDGWWLEPENVADVAGKLGIETVPAIDFGLAFMDGLGKFPEDAGDLAWVLEINGHGTGNSTIAGRNGRERRAEGIVARTSPLLFTRDGQRLMWKLKFKDFA
jgi:hypothetical protein